MSPSRVAACIGIGTLLVAWLASAVGVPRQPRTRAPRPAPEDARVMALATDVQSQASRLRQRLASSRALPPSTRNPFSFASAERRRAEAPVAPVSVDEPLADPVVTEPSLVLIGVAENKTDAGLVRTAMIAGEGDQLFMVIQGESVGGRYEVVAVGADAVELKNTTTGATRRLALR